MLEKHSKEIITYYRRDMLSKSASEHEYISSPHNLSETTLFFLSNKFNKFKLTDLILASTFVASLSVLRIRIHDHIILDLHIHIMTFS